MEDLYRVLQVRRGADQETIAAAFARLSRRYDPSFGGPFADAEKMRQIAGAYAVLGDEAVRRDYDEALASGRGGSPQPRSIVAPTQRPAASPLAPGGTPPPTLSDPWRRQAAPATERRNPQQGNMPSPSPPAEAAGPSPPRATATDSSGGRKLLSPFRGHLPATQPLPVFKRRTVPDEQPAPPPHVQQGPGERRPSRSTTSRIPTTEPPRAQEESDPWRAPTTATSVEAAREAAEPTRKWAERGVGQDSSTSVAKTRPRSIVVAAGLLIVAGAALAVWGSFQAFGRADDGATTREQTEPAADSVSPTAAASDGESDARGPVPEPTVSSPVALPEELAQVARDRLAAEGYELLGVAATNDANGAYFYAALGQDDDGSGQRLFFFLGSEYLGTDWGSDVRSIDTLTSSVDGQISAVYRAYAAGDEACCPSLDPIAVIFTYDGGFASSNADPPAEIFVS